MRTVPRLAILALFGLFLVAGCGNDATPESAEEREQTVAEVAEEDNERRNLEIALGSAAKRLCSSVFISGRSKNHVLQEELSNPALADATYALSGDLVQIELAGLSALALHRPYVGCTLIRNLDPDALREQLDTARLVPPVTHPDGEWPQGNRVTLPDELTGIDLTAINQAVDQAFEDIEPNQNINTRAVLIIHQGRIIAERYAEPFDAGTPQLGWSMTKSLTAALTAQMADDGMIDIQAPAPVPEWQGAEDPRSDIRVHHLLQMSSGLAFSEVYTAGSMSDVILMLYTTGDTGGFAARQPLSHPPGTHFSYASGTTNILARILRDQFDDLHDYVNFSRERLFNPLGMASATIEPDEAGTFVGSSYMYATPRDWARFGLLYLQDGTWEGRRLLPESWVDYALTPAEAAAAGNYGAQIWLNRGPADGENARPFPDLPASMAYLSGFEGQNILLFPEQDLIVLRMGLTRSGPRPVWRLAEQVLDAIRD